MRRVLLLAVLVFTLGALAVAVGSRPSLFVQAPDGAARIVFVRDAFHYYPGIRPLADDPLEHALLGAQRQKLGQPPGSAFER